MAKDRFVKAMLVIIAGLLFFNCVKDNGSGGITVPGFGTRAIASVPAFLQKGSTINCDGSRGFGRTYQIIEIDKESGWIKTIELNNSNKPTEWINTAHFSSCTANP